jgi:hypothetical protein
MTPLSPGVVWRFPHCCPPTVTAASTTAEENQKKNVERAIDPSHTDASHMDLARSYRGVGSNGRSNCG